MLSMLMKAKELRKQSDRELLNLIRDSKEKLRKLRFSLCTRQLKNYNQIGETKKIIARAKTILRERTLSKLDKNLDENK